ncbi:MAG: pallilysin-related adhesin, partial [Treponema sp.]|nr:pallilysin-related adhesin [Treponema sp.]
MTRGFFKILTVVVFIVAALGVAAFVFFPVSWTGKKNRVDRQTRIIIPQSRNIGTEGTDNAAELMAREDSMTAKLPLQEGEVIVSVLNGNFDGNPMEEQFVAYRNLLEIESPIYITFIGYDEASRAYKRVWSAPTAATRPGTISLYTQDLLGDRSICVLLSGMNGLGEHTLTIFRMNPAQPGGAQRNPSQNRQTAAPGNERFSKLAELRIDGSITIRETERTQAYQLGLSRGQSYTIAAYGRDFESSNILDQIEIIYAYNPGNGLYEQTSRTRIPGTQIEQRRVRELLGNTQAFEDFITGLWYYTTPQGTIDMHQYIYFSPATKEIIFYGDETQQVFTWQNSAATRYGLYVSSQNISVTTLRRSIDIELESLDSIKIRVFEDVRLKIGVNAPWDGSYRKAGPPKNSTPKPPAATTAFIDARYDSSLGKIQFSRDGSYNLNAGGTIRQGKYAFFTLNNQEFVELRSDGTSAPQRATYLVEGDNTGKSVTAPAAKPAASGTAPSPAPRAAPGPAPAAAPEPAAPRKNLTLVRVRIGARGVEELHEGPISLSLSQD